MLVTSPRSVASKPAASPPPAAAAREAIHAAPAGSPRLETRTIVHMIVIWGQRMYGRVDRMGGSHVATRFFHLYYVPLIPLSSWLVLEEQDDDQFLGLQLPLQLRSIATAWLRVGSILTLLIAGWNVIEHVNSPFAGLADGAAWAALGGLSVAFALYAFIRLGKLSRRERAKRAVYWDYTGKFVDVALLAEGRGTLKQRTTEELERLLVKHATASYREAPQSSWREVATRPDQRDVPLLRAALTRSRIEWAEARGDARQKLGADHDRIFTNLVAASPELMSTQKLGELDL
jgi:hypothetical protein